MDIPCFLMEVTEEKVVDDIIIDGVKHGTRTQHKWKRVDTGETMFLDDAPVGAIFRATWLEGIEGYGGSDNRVYICRTPGGDWTIDSRASNCTLPKDNTHRCWCRSGEAPVFTVNKKCNTCSAGAGSIQIGDYHGFLVNGKLTN